MNDTVELMLHTHELAATVEALYDALLRRIRWTVQREERQTPSGWAALDFETAQSSIDQLAAALSKSLMLVSEQENLHVEFLDLFTPPPDLWDLISGVTLAEGWAQAPRHPAHELEEGCEVCRRLMEA